MPNKCPECKEKLEKINSIVNLHITGDEKYINLYKCNNCNDKFLIISMEASIGPGSNFFKFRINLEEDEAKKIKKEMDKCPKPNNKDCKCSVHKYLDKFDNR